MLKSLLLPVAAIALALAFSLPASAQDNAKLEFPAPSPASTLEQRVGLTDIKIEYSRPGVKGRQMFGAHEPYGKVWRTGANSATRITFSTPVKFNGVDVPAGTYSLFTIPEKGEWTVILNKQEKQWGAFKYDQSKDLLRVTAKPVHLPELVETFTIDIGNIRDESATLTLAWEKTLVPISLQVDVATTLVPKIEAAMASDGKKDGSIYGKSAQFYLDHGQDLNKALVWANKAVELSHDNYETVYLQAAILAKLGHKDEALAAAKKSEEGANAAKDEGYAKLDRDLISSLR